MRKLMVAGRRRGVACGDPEIPNEFFQCGSPQAAPLRSKSILVAIFLTGVCLAMTLVSSVDLEASDGIDDSMLFTVRAFGDDLFGDLRFYGADDEVVELAFDPFARSRVYALPQSSSEVRFFRMVADDKGREQEETVAVAGLEGIESRSLLVFLAKRDARRNLPYTILVADESPGAFEAGHLRFLNLSGPALKARVGDASFSLDFGFGGDLRFDPTSLEEMPFEFAVRLEDRWQIVYSTGFRAHPNVGTLAILKPPARADSLRIQVELRRMRVFPDPAIDAEAPSDE